MTRLKTLVVLVPALATLAFGSGCEKRPTGLDPSTNTPEGIPAANARLVVYHNTALRVMARDYASTNVDSVVVGAFAVAGPSSRPLLLLIDGTPANSFEMYRRDGAGKFERTADFELQSATKYVNAGYETFFTTDPAPSSFAPPTYLARGLIDGVATHASPLSNEGRLAEPTLAPITYNGDIEPFDSLFVVSWLAVPTAVGYWLHIYEKPVSGSERLLSSLPAPIAYRTAGDLLIGYRAGNNPGGSVQFQIGDTTLLTLKSRPPLLGHDYLVRVSAVDADGQIIAQTRGDLDSLALSADLAYLAPADYSAEKSKIFFSLGGTKVVRQRRLTRGPADAGVAESPSTASMTVERHIPQIQFPYAGPAQFSSTRRRAGHH